jgi:hypothetical protein
MAAVKRYRCAVCNKRVRVRFALTTRLGAHAVPVRHQKPAATYDCTGWLEPAVEVDEK